MVFWVISMILCCSSCFYFGDSVRMVIWFLFCTHFIGFSLCLVFFHHFFSLRFSAFFLRKFELTHFLIYRSHLFESRADNLPQFTANHTLRFCIALVSCLQLLDSLGLLSLVFSLPWMTLGFRRPTQVCANPIFAKKRRWLANAVSLRSPYLAIGDLGG